MRFYGVSDGSEARHTAPCSLIKIVYEAKHSGAGVPLNYPQEACRIDGVKSLMWYDK